MTKESKNATPIHGDNLEHHLADNAVILGEDAQTPAGLRPSWAGPATVAWHYGDPFAEQRRIFDSNEVSVVDCSYEEVITLSGADRFDFFNRLFSQQIADDNRDVSLGFLDLDANGHIVHQGRVIIGDDTLYLLVDRSQLESLRSYLEKMVFWSQVTISAGDLTVLKLLAGSDATLTTTLNKLDEAATGLVAAGRADWRGPARADLVVAKNQLVEVVKNLKNLTVEPVGAHAYETARVMAFEPVLARDLSAASIPHEAWTLIGREDSPGFVHLNKGCYRGQETVARVENLGQPPQLIVLVHLDGSAPTLPEPGTPITAGRRSVGVLGTVIHHYELGPVALARIKRSASTAQNLTADDHPLVVDKDSLPPDTGPKAGRVAVDRLRGKTIDPTTPQS